MRLMPLLACIPFGVVVVLMAGEFSVGGAEWPLRQGKSPWMSPEVRPSAKGRVAVVTSITGGYDAQPPRLPGSQAVRFLFSLTTICRGAGTSAAQCFVLSVYRQDDRCEVGMKCITRSYHLEDEESDVRSINSFSRIRKATTWNNMQAKYYNYLAWRVPELQDYQYIVYVGGDVILEHATNLVASTVALMQGNYTLAVQTHPHCQSVSCEVGRASKQARYYGFASRQLKDYVAQGFPYSGVPGHFWAMAYVYDSHSFLQRQLLWRIFEHVQLWSLDDQIALPYMIWKMQMGENINVIRFPKLCSEFLQSPTGKCRTGHSTSSYGS
jgi:hypothetical protein